MWALSLFFLLSPDDFEDCQEEGEDDEEEEPEGADDDDFVYLALDAFVFDVVNDVEDADAGGFFPYDFRYRCIAWHNPAFFRIFFISKNFFVGEERKDLEFVCSL